VHLGGDTVPPKYKNGKKTGFEEEGKNTLSSKSGTKDVTDISRVGGPVGAELNSMTMPLATPMAKLAAKIFVQKRVIAS